MGITVQIIDGGEHHDAPRPAGTIQIGNDQFRIVVAQYEQGGLNSADAQTAFNIAYDELKTNEGKTLSLNDYYGAWLNIGDSFPLYVFGFKNETTGYQYWVAFYLEHPDSGGPPIPQGTGVQYITSENSQIVEVENRFVAGVSGDLRYVEFSMGFCEQLAQNGTRAVSTHLYIQPK
jgi:hypothetical protein